MPQLLSQVAVGSIVKINENGSPVDFYVAKHDYESGLNGAGKTLLVRKDIHSNRVWNSSNSNTYANSSVDSWLNGTYKSILDASIRSSMGSVKFYYTIGHDNLTVSTLERSVFLLSMTELGRFGTNIEGTALPIASALRSVYYNGTKYSQFTRSPDDSSSGVWHLGSDGRPGYNNCDQIGPVRPAFTLPASSILVQDDGSVVVDQPPTAPASINVPTVAKGQPCAITWTAATDPDGTIASYTLERSINNSGWSQIFSGNALTYTDTIGDSWATVAYRVCAVDNQGLGGPYTTSETQTVRNALIYVEGPLNNIGTQNTPFNFTFTINITGASSTITDIATTVTLDGAQLYSENVSTGQQISINIDTRAIGFETHTINVTASKAGYVGADEDYTFVITPFEFPAGGIATQIQDDSGNVLFPQTVANAVKGVLGGSVGDNLNNLVKSVLYNSTQTPKYQEVTVDLSTAQEGDIVRLPENGQMVDFIVGSLNYESSLNGSGKVLLIRKNGYDSEVKWNNTQSNVWASSNVLSWLNNTYKNLLSNDIQTNIGTTTYYYTYGGGSNNVSTRADSVFLLSATEIGVTGSSSYNVEGSKLSIVNSLLSSLNAGVGGGYWLRSPTISNTNGAGSLAYLSYYSEWRIINSLVTNTSYYVFPCFTLPSTFTATYYVGADGIHDQQEYISGGSFTDYFGNAISMGAKIATGSYVGTGTYGQANPCSLTFDFEPKCVIIYSYSIDASIFVAIAPCNQAHCYYLESQMANPGWAETEMGFVQSFPIVSYNKNSISFYVNGSNNPHIDRGQMNGNLFSYVYVAFG